MVYLKNVDHLHRCPLFLRNSYPHFQLCKACLFMDHVINEMEKNVQESLLLSEIIFTSVLPQAITVSSPEFWNSEFFLHQIKSKNNKNKTEPPPLEGKYFIIMKLCFCCCILSRVDVSNSWAILFVFNNPRLLWRLSTAYLMIKTISRTACYSKLNMSVRNLKSYTFPRYQ